MSNKSMPVVFSGHGSLMSQQQKRLIESGETFGYMLMCYDFLGSVSSV